MFLNNFNRNQVKTFKQIDKSFLEDMFYKIGLFSFFSLHLQTN